MSYPSDDATLGKPFVLVTGCSRSGTTLLSSLFETCLDIAIPVATMWLAHFSRWVHLWGDARRYENRVRLLTAIAAYLRVWRETANDDGPVLGAYTVLPIIEEHGADLCQAHTSWESLLVGLNRRFAAKFGRTYWGEKNSTFPYLTETARVIPSVKVVHIVRDGRDVWLSWSKESFGPVTAAEAAWRWSRQIRESRDWGRRNPNRYFETRYEDLLQNPEAVLADISSFLEIPVVRAPARQFQGQLGRMAAALKNPKLTGPILNHNSRWARELSARDVRVFQSVAGKTMREVCLPLEEDRRGLFSTVEVARDCGRSALNPNLYRLTARSVLPCALRLAQFVRPPKCL